MAPTVHSGASNAERKQRVGEHKSELVARVRYCNTLPDIPFDPKFITYPFDSHRFVQYKPTSLERSYKFDLLTEHDLGVNIDLINPDVYAYNHAENLQHEDERLLEEDALALQDSKRSRHHNKIVPWLKKTEYISTEFSRYGHSSDKTETKVGYNVKKIFKEEDLYMDRESQVNAINKTFEDAKIPIEKHYSKPLVVPVEVLPVFPDFDLWKYPFAQVTFDSDPAPVTQTEEMSQAMIRGVMDESGEQFVAYFLPTEETTLKRKRDAEEEVEYKDEEEYEYKMAREYNWNVKNKASKGYEENYFFVLRENGLFYNELETRVRLSKRRLKPGVQPNNSKLVVHHRPLNEPEFKMQELRIMQLEPPQEEEEEEEGEKEENLLQPTVEDEEDEDDEKKESEDEASESENDDKPKEDKEESEAESEQSKSDEEKDNESENEVEVENKSDNENEENETEAKKNSSESEASSSSESGSESEAEDEDEEQRKKRDEEEIFGSDSD